MPKYLLTTTIFILIQLIKYIEEFSEGEDKHFCHNFCFLAQQLFPREPKRKLTSKHFIGSPRITAFV